MSWINPLTGTSPLAGEEKSVAPVEKLSYNKSTLKKFGLTMGWAFLIIAILVLIRHKQIPSILALFSVFFFAVGLIAPGFLKPIYFIWMKLAFCLSWFNTRLFLIVFFYLVFTPIGLVLRILCKDLLDRRFEKDKRSYWRKKEKLGTEISTYERQF